MFSQELKNSPVLYLTLVLFVHDGMILEWEEGKIINRYPIDESPVTKDMAKAVALMSDERAGIDIYEMPENLYSDLTSFEYGVTFKTTKSLLILKDALSKIAGDELKGKSVDFDRALDENSADINNIEEFVTNLEKHLTVDISRKILQGLLMVEAKFKNPDSGKYIFTKFWVAQKRAAFCLCAKTELPEPLMLAIFAP